MKICCMSCKHLSTLMMYDYPTGEFYNMGRVCANKGMVVWVVGVDFDHYSCMGYAPKEDDEYA